jgi:argininosuccinate lyase
MLTSAKDRFGGDQVWLDATRARVAAAAQRLDQAFAGLRDSK